MSGCRKIAGRALLGLAVCIGGGPAAIAASLSLVPVRVSLSAKKPISAITVRNDGAEATVVQLEVAGWTQADGKDVYAPTSEILATPPIFTVAPGGSQLVRVGLRRAADAEHELTYRVFLQEVPPPPTPDFKGLRVALRFGVPVFVAATKVAPKSDTAPAVALQWHAYADAASGKIRLTAINTGAAHVQVTHFTLKPPADPAAPVEHKVPEYIFPGQHRDWLVDIAPVPAAGAALHVSAVTDAGPVEADIVVEKP